MIILLAKSNEGHLPAMRREDRQRGLSDIWATLLGMIVGIGILGSVTLVYN